MTISQTDFLRLCARLRRPVADAPESAADSEKGLQQAIVDWCRGQRPPWLAWRGSMAHRTFRTPGEPDFFIQASGGRWFAVECKSREGKLSMEQRSMAIQAAELGHTVHVVRSLEEFVELVRPEAKLGI